MNGLMSIHDDTERTIDLIIKLHRKTRVLKSILYVLIVLIIAGLLTGLVYTSTSRPVDPCYEDSVLVGEGQFENGRWTFYVCGPSIDDFTEVCIEGPEE